MPRGSLGQKISFAAHLTIKGKDAVRYVNVSEGTTIRKFCANRGHPELANLVADINGFRSVDTPIRILNRLVPGPVTIAIPAIMAKKKALHILADDPPPVFTGGYAKFDVVARPQRKGLARFIGSDPIGYNIPIQWEHYRDGDGKLVEKEIEALERFAGLDQPDEPPPTIEISVTDNNGFAVPLLPLRFQARRGGGGPRWWIADIQWDANPQRTRAGRRSRQRAVVTVMEYTSTQLTERSATKRWQHTRESAAKAAAEGALGIPQQAAAQAALG